MVIFMYGSAGELIKLAPLMKSIKESEYVVVSTEQQPQALDDIRADLKLRRPDFVLANGYKGSGISKSWQFIFWLPSVLFSLVKYTAQFRRIAKKSPTLVVVHGDTVSTLLFVIYSLLNRFKVAHIESGLRSHNIWNPFPEEIDRRIISKLIRLHFTPSDLAAQNLKRERVKGEVIKTEGNTVIDSVRMARGSVSVADLKLPKKYGIISVRRNEFLANGERVKEFIETIATSELPLVFIDYPITRARIDELGVGYVLKNNSNIIRVQNQSYGRFIKLLSSAEFIVTDSGGIQEECAFLGLPCLLHRLTTERDEGLGDNVMLSKFDTAIVREFMRDYAKYRSSRKDKHTASQPTGVIMKYLRERKYIS